MSRALSAAALAVALLVAPPSRAEEPPSAAPSAAISASETIAALLAEADAAERACDPKGALAIYRRALEAAPGARLSRRAEGRIAWIEARAEGDYAPLAKLLCVQTIPSAELSLDRVRAFEPLIDAFPPGVVRRESRALVADAYLGRFAQPSEALLAHDRWLREAGLSEAERARAVSGRARALDALGDAAASRQAFVDEGLVGRPEARFLRAKAIAETAQLVALAALLAFVVGVVAFGRYQRPDRATLARFLALPRLAASAYLFVVPALIVVTYDATELSSAAWLSFVGWLSTVVAFWVFAAFPAKTRPKRAALGALAFAAHLAASYLALDRTGAVLRFLPPWV